MPSAGCGGVRVHYGGSPVVTLGAGLESGRPAGSSGLCGVLERLKPRTYLQGVKRRTPL